MKTVKKSPQRVLQFLIEILGLPDTPPAAGSEFMVVSDEKRAREVAEYRTVREREKVLERQSQIR